MKERIEREREGKRGRGGGGKVVDRGQGSVEDHVLIGF